jgi:hypothetical protein
VTTTRLTPHRKTLSIEAADELTQYLYLLIDEIQFTSYGEQLNREQDSSADDSQSDLFDGLDDPIPF